MYRLQVGNQEGEHHLWLYISSEANMGGRKVPSVEREGREEMTSKVASKCSECGSQIVYQSKAARARAAGRAVCSERCYQQARARIGEITITESPFIRREGKDGNSNTGRRD